MGLYKVILIEDEIVTREGIRDNVNWNAHGFQFSGDAPDGEIALSLLESTRPDLIITDIKMPFMDGLQLCRIVRERMPETKIIILSGHDEFEYAHKAINLGVKEYILKPVTVEKLQEILDKIAKQLDKEQTEKEKLIKLQNQVNETKAILKERFLLKVVIGAVTSTEAVEESQSLELNLVAKYYLVALLRFELEDRSESFDLDEYQDIQQKVANLISTNPDAFLLKKDWQELVLLMKGNTVEFLEEERDLIIDQIKQKVDGSRYQLTIGKGSPKDRIAFIYKSFIEAYEDTENENEETGSTANNTEERLKLLKIDKSAVDNFLRCGVKEDVEYFYDQFIQELGEEALKSNLIKNYIFMDIIIATAKFINELGEDINMVVEDFNSIEKILMNIKTGEQLKQRAIKILHSALVFRDSLTNDQYKGMISQVKNYIITHFMDPELSLNEVANHVNLSPSHFSVIFSQENKQTFKEYLTEIRILRAKELLRTTSQGANEISIQIGYNDPHYFSYVFKKNTGLSPTEFRLQSQPD